MSGDLPTRVIKIFDTKQHKKVDFIPLQLPFVKIYVCGPTVYDYSHLGHARSAIVFDILRSLLQEFNYQVTFTKNFTDIDDKLIKKSNETGKSVVEIAEIYIKSYLEDMEALGVKRADFEPRATENMQSIIQMIELLLQKEIAYKTDNGDIYLSVKKDPLYGSLSKRDIQAEKHSRINPLEQKQESEDFALWKSYKGEEDVGYPSPFGLGRPGWHIECSAMIDAILAYKDKEFSIDLHGGGADLIFPHHENEASQTRSCGKGELSKYWMHNGFVTINGEKMAKSLGNSFFIKDALKVYDGEILRFYLLSTHYRLGLNFAEADLISTKKRLDRYYRLKKRLVLLGVKEGAIGGSVNQFVESFFEAMSDDLNVSKALSVIDEFINWANEFLDKQKDKNVAKECYGFLEVVSRVLGILKKDYLEYFQIGISSEQREEIEKKIKDRAEAKRIKDFTTADAIRDTLLKMGIAIMDTPEGTQWEKTT